MTSTFVHIGQCGNQLGLEFWQAAALSTADPAAASSAQKQQQKRRSPPPLQVQQQQQQQQPPQGDDAGGGGGGGACFGHAGSGALFHRDSGAPRCVLVDSEPKVVRAALATDLVGGRGGCGGGVRFDCRRASVDAAQAGRANNFAMGFYGPASGHHRRRGGGGDGDGDGHGAARFSVVGDAAVRANGGAPRRGALDAALDAVRREAEASDSFGGGGGGRALVALHALGGGTGAGLGSRLLRELRAAYPAVYLLSAAVLPFRCGGSALQAYNAALALAHIDESCDGCVLRANDAALAEARVALARRRGGAAAAAAAGSSDELAEMNAAFGRDLAAIFLPACAPPACGFENDGGGGGGGLFGFENGAGSEGGLASGARSPLSLMLLGRDGGGAARSPIRGPRLRPPSSSSSAGGRSRRGPGAPEPPAGGGGGFYGRCAPADSAAADVGALITDVCHSQARFFSVRTVEATVPAAVAAASARSARSGLGGDVGALHAASHLSAWRSLAERPELSHSASSGGLAAVSMAGACADAGVVTFGVRCYARGVAPSLASAAATPAGGAGRMGLAGGGGGRGGRGGLPALLAAPLRSSLRVAAWNDAQINVVLATRSLAPPRHAPAAGSVPPPGSSRRGRGRGGGGAGDGPARLSLTVAASRSDTVAELQGLRASAMAKLRAGAYLHWLERHGCERAEVVEALDTVGSIVSRYEELAREA